MEQIGDGECMKFNQESTRSQPAVQRGTLWTCGGGLQRTMKEAGVTGGKRDFPLSLTRYLTAPTSLKCEKKNTSKKKMLVDVYK